MGSAVRKGNAIWEKRPSYLFATLVGLLSSSCCVVQLMLNALSISCAGFSILDPYRPVFLSLTGAVIMVSVWRNGLLTRPTLTTILVAGLLSASPELVKLYNEGGMDSFKWERSGPRTGGDLSVFELEMTGLSCAACANKVKLHIEKQQGVVSCDIFLERMRGVVRSLSGTFTDDSQVEALVAAAGSRYRGKVVKQYDLSVRSGASEAEAEFEL